MIWHRKHENTLKLGIYLLYFFMGFMVRMVLTHLTHETHGKNDIETISKNTSDYTEG